MRASFCAALFLSAGRSTELENGINCGATGAGHAPLRKHLNTQIGCAAAEQSRDCVHDSEVNWLESQLGFGHNRQHDCKLDRAQG